jgi:phage I-like protein
MLIDPLFEGRLFDLNREVARIALAAEGRAAAKELRARTTLAALAATSTPTTKAPITTPRPWWRLRRIGERA